MLRTCSSCKLRYAFGEYFDGAVTGALGGAAFDCEASEESAPESTSDNYFCPTGSMRKWRCAASRVRRVAAPLLRERRFTVYSTELNGEIKQGTGVEVLPQSCLALILR